MPSAQIKFTQNAPGPGAGGNGHALVGVSGTSVLVENVNNTGVDQAQFELSYVPPGSALTTGVKQAYSTDLDWAFTPDTTESFVVKLRVKDADGNESVDVRVFSVLETSGRLIPPMVAGAAMNYAGQLFGWQPYVRAYLKAIDSIETAGVDKLKAGGGGYASVTAAEVRNVSTTRGEGIGREDELHTTNSSDQTLSTYTLPTSALVEVDVIVVAIKVGAAIAKWWKVSRAFLHDGAAVTNGTQRDVDSEAIGGAPTWTVAIDSSSGASRVRVNGQGDDVWWYVARQSIRVRAV